MPPKTRGQKIVDAMGEMSIEEKIRREKLSRSEKILLKAEDYVETLMTKCAPSMMEVRGCVAMIGMINKFRQEASWGGEDKTPSPNSIMSNAGEDDEKIKMLQGKVFRMSNDDE